MVGRRLVNLRQAATEIYRNLNMPYGLADALSEM